MGGKLQHFLVDYAIWIGLVIRIVLAISLPALFDDTEVPYTDIDFYVYNDAAQHILKNGNPFDRTTYRYTPFLAALLARLPTTESARYLFCVADVVCGWILLQQSSTHSPPTLFDACLWMYNPLAINICTRGSAESFMVLLPVLVTYRLVMTQHRMPSVMMAVLAGMCHGVAIHAKLYPIIYTLSFMTTFCSVETTDSSQTIKTRLDHQSKLSAIGNTLWIWLGKLLRPAPFMFGLTSAITFVLLTYLAVQQYGIIALYEGLLYHFSRVDHRHNYSMHWYWIYLALYDPQFSTKLVGRVLLIPQLCLLLYTSLGVAPTNLALALFIQTFVFVTLNKVITAQYFTWYLCLLPLCYHHFTWTKRLRTSLVVLLLSIAFWLGSAYCLEMQGVAVHRLVWFASAVFFVANVNLLGALLSSMPPSKQKAQ